MKINNMHTGSVLALFLTSVTKTFSQETCTLTCSSSGVCAFGKANFTEFPFTADDFPLPFHEVTSLNGQYCECETGFTGIECNTPVQNCDQGDVCFNEGVCVSGGDCDCSQNLGLLPSAEALYFGPRCEYRRSNPECPLDCQNGSVCCQHMNMAQGNIQFYCDCCEAATLKDVFAGQFCEFKATVYCNKEEGINGQGFCVNQGACTSEGGCVCKDGFEGFRCKYPVGTAPLCKLACQNGGTCQKGPKDYGVIMASNLTPFNDDLEHCWCPEDEFSGLMVRPNQAVVKCFVSGFHSVLIVIPFML